MKRLLLAAAGLVGSILFLSSPAFAQPVESVPTSVSAVVPASGSPPEVVLAATQTPTLQRYRVVSGDSLWSIGVRLMGSGMAWSKLAAYNHVANPNLIYVGDVLTVPPAGYSGTVSLPTPAPAYTPPVTHTTHYTAPTRTYTPPPAPVVSRSYGAPGSFQACVATRESGNGSGSSNIYGILNSTWASLGRSGSAWTASRAEQDAAFAQLYARDGTQPWAPYDGC
jgi:LysM repeat protein